VSYAVAEAAINLSNASCFLNEANGPGSTDIEEADMLAKMGVRIMKELKGPTNEKYRWSFHASTRVKIFQGDFSDESKSLLGYFLNDAIQHQGMDGRITGHANEYLGRFHCTIIDTLLSNDAIRDHFQLSDTYIIVSVRAHIINYGPNQPVSMRAVSDLSTVSLMVQPIRNHHLPDASCNSNKNENED
jgi:hypothetical protein